MSKDGKTCSCRFLISKTGSSRARKMKNLKVGVLRWAPVRTLLALGPLWTATRKSRGTTVHAKCTVHLPMWYSNVDPVHEQRILDCKTSVRSIKSLHSFLELSGFRTCPRWLCCPRAHPGFCGSAPDTPVDDRRLLRMHTTRG